LILGQIHDAGSEPLRLLGGEERGSTRNGNAVSMMACRERPRFAPLGFGSCQDSVETAIA
jgi:hypothetical protein